MLAGAPGRDRQAFSGSHEVCFGLGHMGKHRIAAGRMRAAMHPRDCTRRTVTQPLRSVVSVARRVHGEGRHEGLPRDRRAAAALLRRPATVPPGQSFRMIVLLMPDRLPLGMNSGQATVALRRAVPVLPGATGKRHRAIWACLTRVIGNVLLAHGWAPCDRGNHCRRSPEPQARAWMSGVCPDCMRRDQDRAPCVQTS